MEKTEILKYLKDTNLFSKWDLYQTEEMLNDPKSIPINELVERFVEIDEACSGVSWNIYQIIAQIKLIVPVEDMVKK